MEPSSSSMSASICSMLLRLASRRISRSSALSFWSSTPPPSSSSPSSIVMSLVLPSALDTLLLLSESFLTLHTLSASIFPLLRATSLRLAAAPDATYSATLPSRSPRSSPALPLTNADTSDSSPPAPAPITLPATALSR
jgi:hypothetical protein